MNANQTALPKEEFIVNKGSRSLKVQYVLGIQYHLFILYSFLKKFIYLIYLFWLCWVFVAARRLSLVVASGGYSSL